ncbi:MAG: Vitamin B12 transporter BtuB [Holosporales bacterium]
MEIHLKEMQKKVGLVAAACTLYLSHGHADMINYSSLKSLFNESVTTSATGKPQKQSDVPVSMEIISADDIRRSGARNIIDVLKRVNGLTVFKNSQTSADVGIRGQNTNFNPSILVLVNGRQVYLDTYGYTDWSLIPVQLSEIQQIEVVKGPNTALFGFNAATGVINIITFNPFFDKVSNATVMAGNGNQREVNGVATFDMNEKFKFRVSGKFDEEGEFSSRSDAKSVMAAQNTNNKNRLRAMNFDGVVEVADKTHLRLEGSFAGSDSNENMRYSLTSSSKVTNSGKATLTSDTAMGLIDATVYLNTVHGRISPAFYFKQKVLVAQVQDLFKIGKDHAFRVMVEGRRNRMSSPGMLTDNVTFGADSVAASAMWNWSISSMVELTNAVRFDSLQFNRSGADVQYSDFVTNADFNKRKNAFSFNSGVVVKATDNDSVRASVSRGIRSPSLLDSGFNLVTGSSSTLRVDFKGSPELKPTVVENYEVGYNRILSGIKGNFSATLFYNRSKSLIEYGVRYNAFAPNIISTYTDNIGKTQTKGLELSLDGKFASHCSWKTAYFYQKTKDSFNLPALSPGIKNTMFDGVSQSFTNFEDTTPNHVVNVGIGFKADQWEIDGYLQVTSGFHVISTAGAGFVKIKTNGTHNFGMRVAYEFPHQVVVAVSGDQLTKAHQTTCSGLENERRVFVSLTKKF